MKLTRDLSAGARAVHVQCLTCYRMVRLSDAILDRDGPAFRAYYHDNGACLPLTADQRADLRQNAERDNPYGTVIPT